MLIIFYLAKPLHCNTQSHTYKSVKLRTCFQRRTNRFTVKFRILYCCSNKTSKFQSVCVCVSLLERRKKSSQQEERGKALFLSPHDSIEGKRKIMARGTILVCKFNNKFLRLLSILVGLALAVRGDGELTYTFTLWVSLFVRLTCSFLV